MSEEFKKTKKQEEASRLMVGDALHVMLEGGSRSGKTWIICRQLVLRADKKKSRHVILRKHFSHVKQSIWLDTLPNVFEKCFPGLLGKCNVNKSDWFITFPNGSEIWIGGLDDKERTEKILGKEFSTIYFNECSEMDFRSVSVAQTRLAEKSGLKNRFFYDCNPAKQSHWTYKLFHEGKHPDTEQPVRRELFASMLINPMDNVENIDSGYIENVLKNLPPLLRDRFLHGLYGSDNADIIRAEWLYPSENIGPLAAKFTFIDPAFTEEQKATDSSCESAIVTVGVDYSGVAHDLEVQSGFWSYADLKLKAVATHKRHADVPDNYFAVEDVAAQKWLAEDLGKMGVNCFAIRPDRDKIRRMIGITDMLEQGRCRVNNKKLRDQLLGFPGEKLKDLCDAYCGAIMMVKKWGGEKYVKRQTETEKFAGMTSSQAWFKRTMDWERKQRMGEEDVEEFNQIESGRYDPNFY